MSALLILSLTAALCSLRTSTADTPEHLVQTTSGPVIGTTTRSASNKYVTAYYGIPYAQPPTGPLRFQPPKPVRPWTTPRLATSPPPAPHQQIPDDLQTVFTKLNLDIPGPFSEDCLTLHVWVPQPTPKTAAIIVFIHGGAFVTETALWYIDGSALAADEGVILFSVEYRLGVFGFLDLDHASAPGNVGLLDQELALRWVKDNAVAFGGDPDRITLSGTSAGSASVGYQMASESARGLFRRAILMSGVPANAWAHSTREQGFELAKSLAGNLGCWRDDPSATVDCLRTKTPQELLDSSRVPYFLASRQFGPTRPLARLDSLQHDVIIGSTSDEGSEFMMVLDAETYPSGMQPDQFDKIVRRVYAGVTEREEKALAALYKDWRRPDDPLTLREAARRMFADVLFVCHINEVADRLSSKDSRHVYRYVYNHTLTPFWFPSAKWVWSVHGADQVAVFGPPSPDQQESLEDQRIRIKMVKHFANFAKTGDPNLPTDEFPEEPYWPRYKPSTRLYSLMERLSRIEEHHRVQECGAWLHLRPLLNGGPAIKTPL